jgi:hypothetical protein
VSIRSPEVPRDESLLEGFNAEVEREDIFKPAIGNESLHKISNDKFG